MGWLYRAVEQHRCPTPTIPAIMVGFPSQMTRSQI